MAEHGQMTAVSAFTAETGTLELVDGFKRLQASRDLGWRELRVRVLDTSAVEAKAAMDVLNRRGGLTELEQGWLVRSLYREDGLKQPQIGRLLGQHKSWVCRRLMLVELLEDSVQADVRLGLLAARTAVAVARFPRGNQRTIADTVTRQGLTMGQTERLVNAWLAAPDEAARDRIASEAAAGRRDQGLAGGPERRRVSNPLPLRIVADILQMTRVAARLESRLLDRPLSSLSPDAAKAIREHLALELAPALSTLQGAITRSLGPLEVQP
jgi:ParB-like chromosome segregation protein Spo0J